MAAGLTGFLTEGLKQQDLHGKREHELALKNVDLKNQKRLADYKHDLAVKKAGIDNAKYNQSLFGVNYNTTGMTTYQQKAQAGITALSSDPEAVISHIKQLKDSGNSKLYQQQLAQFKNMYQTVQMELAKASGTERGVAGVPDMNRALPGLVKIMNANGMEDIRNWLVGQNASFGMIQAQATRMQQADDLRKKAKDKSPAVQAAVERLIESGVSLTNVPTDKLISGYSTPLSLPQQPAGTQNPDAGKQLGSFYSKPDWETNDFVATGNHFRIGFKVPLNERMTATGAAKLDRAVSQAYDDSKRMFVAKGIPMRRGQYALANRDLAERQAHAEMMKTPATRKEIERKQSMYRTMKAVSTPLIQIGDLLADKNVKTGFAGLIQKYHAGAKGQISQFLNFMGVDGSRTLKMAGESDEAFKARKADRALLFATLRDNLGTVERFMAVDDHTSMSTGEKQALIESLGNLSAFLLARYVQADDNKISNDDVKQMRKNIGLDAWISGKGMVKSKLQYYIKDAQKHIIRLEGYSTGRQPMANAKNYQHALLWERMMEESGQINPNTGQVILTPDQQFQIEQQKEKQAGAVQAFGPIPGNLEVNFSEKEAKDILREGIKHLNMDAGAVSAENEDSAASNFMFNKSLTDQVRRARANKSQLSENVYVTTFLTKGGHKHFIVKLGNVAGKLVPSFESAFNTPEDLLKSEGISPSAAPPPASSTTKRNVVSEKRAKAVRSTPKTNNTADIEQKIAKTKARIAELEQGIATKTGPFGAGFMLDRNLRELEALMEELNRLKGEQ